MLRLSAVAASKIVVLLGFVAFWATPSPAEPILGEGDVSSAVGESGEKQNAVNGLALFKSGDYAGSLQFWREAAGKNPDLPPPQLIMAQLYMQAKMAKEARDAIEKAAAESPRDPEVYLLQAAIAIRDGNLDKAESLYQKAHGLMLSFTKSTKRKDYLRVQIYLGMAGLADARKDWDAEKKLLEECVKLQPKNMALRQRIALILLQQKDVDGALASLREAAKADPTAPAPEVTLAQFYRNTGDNQSADKWMAAAVAAAPKNLKTRVAAGYDALQAERLDDGMTHAIAAMKLDPLSAEAKALRGLISVCQKDYVASELFFQAVLQRSPEDFVASNNLALALIEQNDEPKTRRAIELAEGNARRFPQSASALSTYGWVLYKTGKLAEAEKALRAAAKAGPLSIDTSYYTARVLVDRDQKDEARKLLENALKGHGLTMCRPEAEALLKELTAPEAAK